MAQMDSLWRPGMVDNYAQPDPQAALLSQLIALAQRRGHPVGQSRRVTGTTARPVRPSFSAGHGQGRPAIPRQPVTALGLGANAAPGITAGLPGLLQGDPRAALLALMAGGGQRQAAPKMLSPLLSARSAVPPRQRYLMPARRAMSIY